MVSVPKSRNGLIGVGVKSLNGILLGSGKGPSAFTLYILKQYDRCARASKLPDKVSASTAWSRATSLNLRHRVGNDDASNLGLVRFFRHQIGDGVALSTYRRLLDIGFKAGAIVDGPLSDNINE